MNKNIRLFSMVSLFCGVLSLFNSVIDQSWAQHFFNKEQTHIDSHQYELEARPLGYGGFGSVHRLKRKQPGKEQGILDPSYVVKVFHDPENIISAMTIQGELQLNEALVQRKLSQIEIFPSIDHKYHVKTFVDGQNLGEWLERERIFERDQEVARKEFIKLWMGLVRSRLSISDLQPYNMMYDEKKLLWEVIDGEFHGEEYPTLLDSAKNYWEKARGFFSCRHVKDQIKRQVCQEFLIEIKNELNAEVLYEEKALTGLSC